MSNSLASLFKSVTTGVYVVGVAHGEVRNAFTAAFVMQVSYDPLLLALSINPHHSSYGLLNQGGVFSVNVLTKGQLALAAQFGGPVHLHTQGEILAFNNRMSNNSSRAEQFASPDATGPRCECYRADCVCKRRAQLGVENVISDKSI